MENRISFIYIIRLMNLYQFTLLSRGIRMGFCCRALDCRDRLIFEATTGADSASKLGHAALFSRCPLWIFIWSIWPAKLIVIWICWIMLNPWSLGLAKSCPAEDFESTWQIKQQRRLPPCHVLLPSSHVARRCREGEGCARPQRQDGGEFHRATGACGGSVAIRWLKW